jgi:hypothetical protein
MVARAAARAAKAAAGAPWKTADKAANKAAKAADKDDPVTGAEAIEHARQVDPDTGIEVPAVDAPVDDSRAAYGTIDKGGPKLYDRHDAPTYPGSPVLPVHAVEKAAAECRGRPKLTYGAPRSSSNSRRHAAVPERRAR